MKQTRNHYSESFKQQVLDDYFQSNMSKVDCAQKWNVPPGTFGDWVSACRNHENSITLRSKSTLMNPTDQALENLRIENEKLRREVEYQKLQWQVMSDF